MDKKDLQQIKQVIKKEIFSTEKSLKKEIQKEVGDLAIMTKKGFDKVEGRLDKVEGRLDKVEKKVNSIDSNMVTKFYFVDKLADLVPTLSKSLI